MKEIPNTARYFYMIILLVAAVLIWTCFHDAQFLEYDENWGSIISGFLISFFVTIAIIALWFKLRKLIKSCLLVTSLFLLTSSPITLVILVMNYSVVFGGTIKN